MIAELQPSERRYTYGTLEDLVGAKECLPVERRVNLGCHARAAVQYEPY